MGWFCSDSTCNSRFYCSFNSWNGKWFIVNFVFWQLQLYFACSTMNQQMYQQTVTQQNLVTLKQRGTNYRTKCRRTSLRWCRLWANGRTSSNFYRTLWTVQEQSLAHLTVTITAGPTREALDLFDILVIIVQVKWVLRLLKPLLDSVQRLI